MTGALLFIFALFLIGMALIAIEAFLIPGFGVTGIVGGLMVIGATVYACVQSNVLLGMTLGIVALILSFGFLIVVPKTRVGKKLTLHNQIDETSQYDAEAKRAGVAVGHRGITVTELKPSGFAVFNGERVEVRSDGEWIGREVDVTVTELKNGRVFVETVGD